ncbi:MAG: hypothetical protein ACRDFS_06990 [Chloroflexota bacterium]
MTSEEGRDPLDGERRRVEVLASRLAAMAISAPKEELVNLMNDLSIAEAELREADERWSTRNRSSLG